MDKRKIQEGLILSYVPGNNWLGEHIHFKATRELRAELTDAAGLSREVAYRPHGIQFFTVKDDSWGCPGDECNHGGEEGMWFSDKWHPGCDECWLTVGAIFKRGQRGCPHGPE